MPLSKPTLTHTPSSSFSLSLSSCFSFKALDHAWFKEKPLPKDPELLPTFPSGHEKEKIHSAAEAPSLFHRPKSDAYSLIGSARTGGFTLKY